METSHVRLFLDSHDAERRTTRFRLDAETIRDSWSSLPKDVRLAQREMLRIGEVQQRLGHMRRAERVSFRSHQDHVQRRQEEIGRQVEQLRRTVRNDDAHADYQRRLRDGTTGAALARDPRFAALHANVTDLRALEAQQAAMGGTAAFLGGYGVTGRFSPGGAASYWGRRAMFGAGPDGTPRTLGGWAADTTIGGARSAIRTARQVTGLFTAFQGLTMVTRSMSAFEERAEAIQELGARLGGTFNLVTESLDGPDGLRERFKYTLAEIRPGLSEYARLRGTLDGAAGALGFARATGMAPGAALGRFGGMGVWGNVDTDLVERSMRAAGMTNRADAYLSWLSGTQSSLGAGFYSVPEDQAVRMAGFVSRAMGEPFRNQRGAALTQQLIGGMRGEGNPAVLAAKMHAIRGLGQIDLGGGVTADTSTWRGMRMALESGHTDVLEAFYRESVRLGGEGQFGEEVFQKLTGVGSTMASTRLFRDLRANGGRLPSEASLRGFANLDAERAGVADTVGYDLARQRTETETKVYERIGEKLQPIAMDFKDAGLALATRMGEATSAMDMAGKLYQGLGEALTELNVSNRSDATPWVFNAALLFGSKDALTFGGIKALLAGIQAGKAHDETSWNDILGAFGLKP